MKKNLKIFVITLLLSFVSFSSTAQIRHVKGIKSLDLEFGISKYGNIISGGYVMYFSQKLYGKTQIFYENGKNSNSVFRYQSLGGDVGAAYTFFEFKEILFFNAIGGLTINFDKQIVSSSDISLIKIPNVTKYGVFGGIETEVFINDNFVFLINFNQRYLLGKDVFGKNRWFCKMGLRYNF